MVTARVESYIKLILELEAYTIKEVPKRYHKEVKAELRKRGYDEKGNQIPDNGEQA